MKNNNFRKKRKLRKPINNAFFWAGLWCLWTGIIMIIFPFAVNSFNSLKNYYYWWVIVALIFIILIIMFIFWLTNYKAWKVEVISNNQTKIK